MIEVSLSLIGREAKIISPKIVKFFRSKNVKIAIAI